MAKAKSQYKFHVRHWREKWDPKADLIFTRRMKLGLDPKNPIVQPGDPVTPEIRERLGIRKLLLWWHSKHVGLRKWMIKNPASATGSDPSQTIEVPEGSIYAIGGGWYRVTLPNGTEMRVRGRKKAQALLEG